MNIHLFNFIRDTHFDDIHFWRYEDGNYLHMDLVDLNQEGPFYKNKVKELEKSRDEFFEENPELLPSHRKKDYVREEDYKKATQ